jgi:TolA-binding protein
MARALARLAVAAVLLLAIATSITLWRRSARPFGLARSHESRAPAARAPRLPLEKPAVVPPAATGLVFRGAHANAREEYVREFGTAIDPYRANNYGRAISRLTALRNRYPAAAEPPFYLGACRLLAGDAEGALPSLEQAAALSTDERRDEALWYTAVAEERAGRVDAARRTLQELCTRTGPRQSAACEGIKTLR